MCHSIPVARALHQAIPNNCTAKTLGPGERLSLGVQALAGHQSITGLAQQADVSRKFVYQQADTRSNRSRRGLRCHRHDDDKVLFHLPVTKDWLRQVVLALTLICHSSYRGVHEFFRDLLDFNMSLGTVAQHRPRGHRQGSALQPTPKSRQRRHRRARRNLSKWPSPSSSVPTSAPPTAFC